MTRVQLTLRSRNQKTGPIPVSMTERETCPDACSLKGAGCYAESGPLSWVWGRMAKPGHSVEWDEFCEQVAALPAGTLWRHNQAGDLPGEGNLIDPEELSQLILANRGRRGFTYTHKPMAGHGVNRMIVGVANQEGFTINLSADNPAHADELAALGIAPVVTLLPADTDKHSLRTPGGRRIVVCPATYRDDSTCKSCGACADASTGRHIIGFTVHGPRAKTADQLARG